jgi:DNA-binding SARP family transcriptional activator
MPPASRHRLITLGRLTLFDQAGNEDRELATRKRKLALLTVLATSRRPWTRDALVDLFWGEQDEARARHSLSDTLSHLRRVLGPDAISQRRTEVALADDITLDVDVLDLQEAARVQQPAQVVALYGGPFLDGVHVGGSPRFEQWIDGERRRIDGLFATAARVECETLLRSGRPADSAALAARWLAVAPTSPHAALFRLRALAADETPEADQRALDEYAAIARQLERDYDTQPDRMVVTLAEELSARVRGRQAAPPSSVASQVMHTSPEVVSEVPPIASPRRTRRWLFAVTAAAITTAAALALFVWKQPSPNRTTASPPAAVTSAVFTDSPAARALYDRAVLAYDRDGNREDAVRLLDSAIAIDSTFAMAYRRLGQIYDNGVDGRSRSIQMLTLAARHATRLPEAERLITLGSYHLTVTGNFARAASAYRALLDLEPNDARAWANLGTVYDHLGDRQRAVDAYERSIALNPKRALTWMNLSDGRYALGDVAGAWRTLDSMSLAFPGYPGLFMRSAALAHAEGKRELAESQLRALITSANDNVYLRAAGEMLLAKAYWSWGRLDEGDAARERAVRLDVQRGARDAALTGALDLAMATVWLRGDTASARARITAALRATPLTSLSVEDRPYLDASIALASSGQSTAARAMLTQYLQVADSLMRRRDVSREHHARGMIAMASQQWPEAMAQFRQVPDALCNICGLPELALAYTRAGQRDSATAIVQRYRATPSQRRLDMTEAFHGEWLRRHP